MLRQSIWVTIAFLVLALALTVLEEFLALQVVFTVLAATVAIFAYRSESMTYTGLGWLLFVRFCLENSFYPWPPMGLLATGHLVLGICAYFRIKNHEDSRQLMIFPVLMLSQALIDSAFMLFKVDYYVYLHNILAIMQMSVFLVVARHHKLYPKVKKDYIEELISKLTRTWVSGLLSWKNNTIT